MYDFSSFCMTPVMRATRKKNYSVILTHIAKSTSQYFKIMPTSHMKMHTCACPSKKTWTEMKNYASNMWGLWGFVTNKDLICWSLVSGCFLSEIKTDASKWIGSWEVKFSMKASKTKQNCNLLLISGSILQSSSNARSILLKHAGLQSYRTTSSASGEQ